MLSKEEKKTIKRNRILISWLGIICFILFVMVSNLYYNNKSLIYDNSLLELKIENLQKDFIKKDTNMVKPIIDIEVKKPKIYLKQNQIKKDTNIILDSSIKIKIKNGDTI